MFIFNPPIWLQARRDLTNTQKFSSTEGKFSVEIPKSWELNKTPSWRVPNNTHDISFGNGEIYLRALGEIYVSTGGRRQHPMSRRDRYAYMSVAVTTTSQATGAKELSDALVTALREERTRLETQNTSIPVWQLRGPNINNPSTRVRFEVRKLKAYSWAKTTVTDLSKERTYEYWQTVNSMSNQHTITFETDNISHYEPIFENIMKSFMFNH